MNILILKLDKKPRLLYKLNHYVLNYMCVGAYRLLQTVFFLNTKIQFNKFNTFCKQ